MRKRRQVAKDGGRQMPSGDEWRVLLALIVLTGAAIGGLYLVARNAPSSGVDNPDALVVPAISSSTGCANFASYWMEESGVQVDAAVIEGLTNCALSKTGEWFVPNSPSDARLPDGYALTDEEHAQAEAFRQELLSQVDDLEASLSSSIERDLESIYDAGVRPITGHIKDGVGISRPRSRYTRVIQAYLLAPEHEALAGYVGWLMAAKINAYETLTATCLSDPELAYLRTVCLGIEDSMSVRYPPFIWDLRDSVSLEEYLAHLVRTNQLPDSGQTIAVDASDIAMDRDWSLRLGQLG